MKMDAETVRQKLAGHYLFRSLSPAQADRLLTGSVQKRLSNEQALWSKKEPFDYFAILLEGKLKIILSDAGGNAYAIKHILPVDSLGDATITGGGGQLSDVVSAGKSLVLLVRKKDTLKILEQNPAAALALCAELSRRIENLTTQVSLHVFARGSARILYRLAQLKPENSRQINITHEQLAQLVGMTRERLTLGLQELEDLGYVRKKRGAIIIEKPEIIEELTRNDT
jgi:CRP/FNR family transcriptional regulator